MTRETLPTARRVRAGASAAVVARIPYLNSLPYYVNWPSLTDASDGSWVSIDLPPRQLSQAAERGEIDAGLMAVADLARLAPLFEPLVSFGPEGAETFGIANRGRVDSVLLFVRDEIHGGLAGDGLDVEPGALPLLHDRLIAVSSETSTSFRLLRLLLEVRAGVVPRYLRCDLTASPPAGADAALVIGDTALRWRHRPPAHFRQSMDLAWAWRSWTALPFTFARWVVHRDVALDRRLWLGRFLSAALQSAAPRYRNLVEGCGSDLGGAEVLTRYLQNFTYRLSDDELRAATRYEELLREHQFLDTP